MNARMMVLTGAAVAAFTATAAWTTDVPFSDHMVIQAGQPVTLTGKGSGTNNRLSCTIAGKTVWTYGMPNAGDFRFVLPPLEAGGPYELVISNETSGATLKIQDVMVGEVWLAAGQSNMAWTMKDCNQVYDATNEMVRIYREKKWVVATPENVKNQSAEGFWFAETLQRKRGGAVGILSVAVGGTYAVCWMSHGAAKACPEARILLDDFELNQGDPVRWARKQFFEYDEPERSRVQKNPPPAEKRAPGANPWGNGPWSRPYRWGVHRNYRPNEYYHAWIEPLIEFPVRGAFWHQGESEAWASTPVAQGYGPALKALIADWRYQWGMPDMPFGIVRIHDYGCDPKCKENWKAVQDAQEAVAREVPNCGFVETKDIGDAGNVHFPNKRPVGERLAAWALKDVYGVR